MKKGKKVQHSTPKNITATVMANPLDTEAKKYIAMFSKKVSEKKAKQKGTA